MSSRLSIQGIERAAAGIDPAFVDTPQFMADGIGARVGLRLVCKVETLNPIRSFKGRGADWLVQSLDERHLRLVCASAGNFGQGVAWAGGARGMPVTVFAAESASPLKLARMRALGADVRLAGADLDEAKAAAREFALSAGARFVEDGREAAIAEGAGTIGLELGRWSRPLDAVLVPVGNGALASGVGCWMRARSPTTRVVGVCAQGAPSMERSWRLGRLETTERVDTIADGIAVRVPVPEALADMRDLVDEMRLVGDDLLLDAARMVFSELGLVVEPAGAAGLAALLDDSSSFAGQEVATVLCGGNLSQAQVRDWLLQ